MACPDWTNIQLAKSQLARDGGRPAAIASQWARAMVDMHKLLSSPLHGGPETALILLVATGYNCLFASSILWASIRNSVRSPPMNWDWGLGG